MVQSGLLWVLLVSVLVLAQGFDERPDLHHDEDLHPSSLSEAENWDTTNTDWDQDEDLTEDRTHEDMHQFHQESLDPDLGLDQDKDHDQSVVQSGLESNSSLCGDFNSETMTDGQCRIRAMFPAISASSSWKRCPDLFRCSAEASEWLKENINRKQQIQEVTEAVTELQDEIKSHQRRVKALEIQSEGHMTLNSSVIGRLHSLELHHAEASTLLHVHAALLHELQTQLQNLSSVVHSGCTLKNTRTPPPLAIRSTARPVVHLVSSCPSDCASLFQNGVHRSGVYSIVLTPGVSLPVYCDMDTDGGGWTVFQRRRDGSVSFNRGWDQYSLGFGDSRSEHWLGNTPLHLLVTQRNCSLRIQLLDWSHIHRHAAYERFSIEDEQNRFRLHLSGFSGTVPDSFGWYHDGQDFSSPDSGDLCAEICHSGWWFQQCFQANLNGVYYQGGHYSLRAQNLLGPDGVVWFSWRDSDFYSLKAVTMMVRPLGFRTRMSP